MLPVIPLSEAERLLAGRVKALRELRGWSRGRLAKAIGLSLAQMGHTERGQTRLSAGRLLQIARALDFPITAFFEGLVDRERAHAA